MRRAKKKGFAIILVASLAGLVFLLGASLVAVSRLQTASANYDQRVRLAREHARASLDMAVAQLQEALGSDASVSYTADVYRDDVYDDFKVPSDPLDINVVQPFWTAADDGSESWLVTRPITSDFNGPGGGFEADPLASEYTDSVTLLGLGTVGGWDDLLGVSVPKEKISVEDVQGYTDARTIGHYAYWVGDLGTKASYALYDRANEVGHDEYTLDRQNRLRQLGLAKPIFASGIVDTNSEGQTPSLDNSNPMRIDSFSNDFQFASRFGTAAEDERYLDGLTDSEFQQGYHDFTPLSKGLLVNGAVGDFKENLSVLVDTGDADFDDNYKDFASLAKSAASTATSYNDHVFPIQGGDLPIAPVITEFNLNYSVYLSGVAAGNHDLFVSFAATVELWNPYSSAIDLGANKLVLVMENLPQLEVDLVYDSDPTSQGKDLDLGVGPLSPVFEINQIGSDSNILRPGQVAYFRGPSQLEGLTSSPHEITFGGPGTSADRVVVDTGLEVTATNTVVALEAVFKAGAEISTSDFGVTLKMVDPESVETVLAYYDLEGEFSLDPAYITDPVAAGIPSFGFSWKISDSVLANLENYSPLDTTVSVADGGIDLDCWAAVNRSTAVPDNGEFVLLGHNPSDFEATLDTSYDVSVLQLPKQELGSVAQLSHSFGPNSGTGKIGDPLNDHNDFFDQYFFSTVPTAFDGTDDWSLGGALPNAGYRPVPGATASDVSGVDAAEHLFVHGMFNVHSTSIDAWVALLKSCPASSIPYWHDFFDDLEEGGEGDGTLDTELYLMFNFPLGGEDLYQAGLNPAGSLAEFRASWRQSVFAFEEADIELLAKHIVANIRERLQGSNPYVGSNKGPFSSLQDFVDSEVLENAIADAHAEIEVDGASVFNFVWAQDGAPADFHQSTILNLIGAYISVRSDTFVVRAYGDAVDPADPSKIWARAYCEAIVQRTHEVYSDSDPSLGRKFEVVAFRWLSPSEI